MPIPSRDELERLYRTCSMQTLIEKYGVSASTIKRWRRTLGVTPNRRRNIEIPSKEALATLYTQHPDAKIAGQFGVSEGTVRRWRRRYSIGSRPRGRIGTTPSQSTVSDSRVATAVAASLSVSNTLRHLGLSETGSGHRVMTHRIKSLGLDTSHFTRAGKRGGATSRRIPLQDILRKGTRYNGSRLRKRLVEAGLLKDCCAECGLHPSWNGKQLQLQLDHIDGDHTNNLLVNLRILCPNCHTQTPTFAGRNARIK